MPASQADSGRAPGARPVASSHGRIDDIQVLRAAAIGCVLVEHSWYNLLFHQAWLNALVRHWPLWCGVDLFFVISGFVITRSLLPSVLKSAPAGPAARDILARFWIRRAFRIWPAAWLWLALIVVGSLIFSDPPFMGTLALNVKGALAGIFGYANIRFALHPFQLYGASYPYWSLSLEEQFYVLLPPVMLLARRRIIWVALAALLVQLPLAHGRLYFFCRNDGLLWGVVVACLPVAAASRSAAWTRKIPLAGLSLLAASIAALSAISPPGEKSPAFLLGAMAAIAALPVWLASGDYGVFRMGWLQPAAMWMGSRSYALYLCHVPIYQLAAALGRQLALAGPLWAAHADLVATAFGLPVLAAAADMTYRMVEMPLRVAGARLAALSVPARQSS